MSDNIFTINIKMDKKPTKCFECDFSIKEYCWSFCPFLKMTIEDKKRIPSDCPLKKKNYLKTYNYSIERK